MVQGGSPLDEVVSTSKQLVRCRWRIRKGRTCELCRRSQVILGRSGVVQADIAMQAILSECYEVSKGRIPTGLGFYDELKHALELSVGGARRQRG